MNPRCNNTDCGMHETEMQYVGTYREGGKSTETFRCPECNQVVRREYGVKQQK